MVGFVYCLEDPIEMWHYTAFVKIERNEVILKLSSSQAVGSVRSHSLSVLFQKV